MYIDFKHGMKSLTDCRVLANGVKMPCVGFGTWQTPDGAVAEESVKQALAAGYRHIDTASAYGNEASVGAGIRASGVKREEVFLTSKQWTDARGYDATIAACEKSLKTLGVDYLDLYLVHWPAVAKIRSDWAEINAETWRGFEKLLADGKVRAIGVSNFLPEQLEALKKMSTVCPMVDQIEYHPGYIQKDVTAWCRANGVQVEAWSPLGCGRLLSNPIVNAIAVAHGKSAAHVCIRFAIQSGVVPLPKSVHAERIVDNADVFDFDLSDDDMVHIGIMSETGYSGYHPNDGCAG